MDNNNLDDLYDNLVDLDNEEEGDNPEDEQYDEDDEEDCIAEDPGDDDNWWHGDKDQTTEVISDSESSIPSDDDSIAQTTDEPIESIDYRDTTEIEAALTGEELFHAIADLFERILYYREAGGKGCSFIFLTKDEFDNIPEEDKVTIQDENWFEPTGDDYDDEDDIDLSDSSALNKIFFITDS